MSKMFETLQRLEAGDLATNVEAETQQLVLNLGAGPLAIRAGLNPRFVPPAPAATIPELVLWSSLGLINDLATLATSPYESSPWGGVEVGGVLFGTVQPDGVHIRNYRAFESEHRHGPSFDLSDRDLERLNEMLVNSKHDDTLTGFVPVGWYHSVSQREFCLTKRDIDLHERFFSEPWQVAMLLKRSRKNPAVFGLCFRKNSERIPVRPISSYTLGDLRSRQSLSPSAELMLNATPQVRAVHGSSGLPAAGGL